ncbi:MAG: hypothetical protein HRO68_09005 [Nitrosopumilus sp.]|nr:hypothetical protein [Nitrosopumilus sp.]
MGFVMVIAVLKFGKISEISKKQKPSSKEIVIYLSLLSGIAGVITTLSLIQPLPFLIIDFFIKRPYEIIAVVLFSISTIIFYKQKLNLLNDYFYKGVLLLLLLNIFVSLIISYSSFVFDTSRWESNSN